jgi:hypothetical protein
MRSPTCAECGSTLAQPRQGRTRIYCSGACRQAAYRRRNAVFVDWTDPVGPDPVLTPWSPPGAPPPPVPLPSDKPAPPEEQLAVALLELYAYTGILRRLAHDLHHPQHCYRTETLGDRLAEALQELFPV